MADIVFNRVRKSNYLRDVASGIIAETHTPSDIFSLKGLFRSLWK
jgi:hypothetical protein